MLTSVRVPAPMRPAFELAEALVKSKFEDLELDPSQGTIHVGGERYVLVRADSFYLGWMSALRGTFGDEAASGFIYNTGREIGRSDSTSFSQRLALTDGVARLASGPVHFAHAGWAFVEIFEDSVPAVDDSFFLHYVHPNTFETEVLRARGLHSSTCACLFSAGYSAGWCSEAFGVEVHAREITCLARGDSVCEFVMAPEGRLDEHEARLRAKPRPR